MYVKETARQRRSSHSSSSNLAPEYTRTQVASHTRAHRYPLSSSHHKQVPAERECWQQAAERAIKSSCLHTTLWHSCSGSRYILLVLTHVKARRDTVRTRAAAQHLWSINMYPPPHLRQCTVGGGGVVVRWCTRTWRLTAVAPAFVRAREPRAIQSLSGRPKMMTGMVERV